MEPSKVEKIVLACTTLNNYLRKNYETAYTPVGIMDKENYMEGTVVPSSWRDDRQLLPLERLRRNTAEAKIIRHEFKTYFSEDGAVPWQYRMSGIAH